MAFFTDWVKKIGSVFTPKRDVEPVALVLSKSDGSPDMAQSDGSGALMVNLAAGEGLATEAKQDSQITQETEINAHVHSIDGKITACNTGAVTVAASALPAGAATETTLAAAEVHLGNIDAGIPAALGTAAMAASMPVTIATDDTVLTGGTQATKIVNGASTMAVKAASTAAAAADPAAVVSLSPNSPVYSAIGTWTPATAAAAGNTGVIQAAACKGGRVMAVNSHATITYYLQLFDAAAVPANATAPRLPSIPLVPGQAVMLDLGGMTFANGLCWAASTTVATKTAAATNPFQCSAEIL